MKIKPLGNRLVVELTKKETTTASGIIISTEDKKEQQIGKVIAIGEGQGNEENIKELSLKVGDRVIFGKYSGEEIQDDIDTETIYKILNGKDVIAVIK